MTKSKHATVMLVVAAAMALATSSAVASPAVYGLGSSAYMDGQGPPQYLPPEQIRSRLGLVASYSTWIRTWGSASGLENTPGIAREFGLNVAQCAFVNGDPVNDELQKANLVASVIDGDVDIAIVGTESLVSGLLTEAALIGHLTDVRGRLDAAGLHHIPVTTAEPYGTWANSQPGGLFRRDAGGDLVHAAVLDNIDQLFVHVYPFHEGTHIDAAKQNLADMYAEVMTAVDSVAPSLPVVIGETGWPSAGDTNGQAVPSLQNEGLYFSQVTEWSVAEDIPVFWFEAFDENWKDPGYVGVERHWGLHYADGSAKPVPEPSSLAFVAVGVVGLCHRHRRCGRGSRT